MRFLIVDDSRAVQSIVRRAIQGSGLSGLEFETAADGHSALEIVERWLPDLVITDWHMPGMNGIELLQQLRARFPSTLKVGFVTTETAQASHDEAFRLGALFVLNKPFLPEELGHMVRQALTEPAPAPARGSPAPIRLAEDAEISGLLERALKQQVRIEPMSPEPISHLSLPGHVSLCSVGATGEVRGLCLLDFSSATTIGGTLLDKSLPDIRKAQATRDLGPEWVEQITQLLSRKLPEFYRSHGGQTVGLAKSQLIRQAGPQLHEIFRRCSMRSDFLVSRGDLPVGRLTILAR